jgi:hypothetical protein
MHDSMMRTVASVIVLTGTCIDADVAAASVLGRSLTFAHVSIAAVWDVVVAAVANTMNHD